MTGVRLAPSILTADFGRLAEQIRSAEAGGADYIHLDVMDGRFVPPITFGPLVVKAVRETTRLPLDVHLMIERPERQFDAFAGAGADMINFHIEATAHADRLLREVQGMGKRAGICLNPATPVAAVDALLAVADQVMVMTINPGWGGQPMIPATLEKVREVRRLLVERGLTADIEVDGGVKVNNAAACVAAGANVLVCGSSVYNRGGTPQENLRGLREALAVRAGQGRSAG